MKSNAPWSVKGIERDARETAKEAAKREGMTVGEWLNQMIYSAGDPESSGGHVEGLKIRDIVTAIDHLHKRIADSAAETGDAVTDVSRKMGDIVERVQRLERGKPASGDRERVDALKALEKAVSQVAVQFSNSQKTTLERLDATEKSIQDLTETVTAGGNSGDADASGVEFLKNAIDGLQSRMAQTERLARESANGEGDGDDAEFRESTSNRLRVLGDEIKRGGDQIRTLEQTISKLSKQIDAAERRSAEGVQKTAETLTELREKFAGETFDAVSKDDIASVVAGHLQDTTSRIDSLQASLENMISRLEERGDETPAEALITHPEKSHEEPAALAETAEEEQASSAFSETVDSEEEASADSNQPAASETSEKLDDDDEFFSFSDDIDASIDEVPASDREDGFSFELDDADETAESKGEHDPAGDDILSEVQKAFSETAPSDDLTHADDDASEAVSDDDEKASVDKELDELLAGLDDIGEENTDADSGDGDDDEAEAPPFAQAEAEEAASSASPSKEDLLKSIRRKAREEAAARAAGDDDERPSRRKLTPKQRAILAARARRKRLAEQKGDEAEDAAKAAATKKAFEASAHADEMQRQLDAHDADDDEDDEENAGFFASLRAKLPFLNNEIERAEDTVADDLGHHDAESDREALETLKSTASARPVTLALAIGIFLAIGVIFFAVRDFVFSPRDDVASGADTASVEEAAEPAGEPSLEAPEPPAVDPKTLYDDAMTGLNAAGNEAETAVAIEKLKQAALLGHPPAQLQLGELYKTGQGVDQDLAQARTWFRRAANGGNVLAMHRIGVMTARGDGGSASTPEAINWFEQAANRGLVDSQYNLGAIYHPSGEGETGGSEFQDAGKAYYWYSLAAQNGDEQAKPLASGVGAALNEAERSELDEAITEWAPVPADIEANTLANAG